HVVKSAGKIPAQRSSAYRILKEFSEAADDLALPLDTADPTTFGSYQELIKIGKYRYTEMKR
ncbi:MAG TPA: 7,8-didemethyl-8-hydroxy-5-deazariboflavin synthase subunit CofH, partial [Nitrososphaeraceae archaeon]|nr:7,8-didemethyl-8-hydroxy-5-deazariboflavin synthase subunit CofH [Nitrososphaeraceae archaeon]